MARHERYIQRCIDLARNGLGRTYPNPMVGCVIVHQDRIIGEGWHRKAGEAHAEVNAIMAVKDQQLLKKATLYVSLEPCSHYGKTPPCSNLIIDKGIPRVVIGTVDPFSEVSGKGITRLMNAGCEVTVGVKEKECEELNKRFFTFHTKRRPYIILKWAGSEDGFISPEPETQERQAYWISSNYSRQLVHKWRTEEVAILVGTTTAISDNPKLNARKWIGNDPVRVVLDRELRIPRDSHLFDGTIKTLVLTEKNPPEGSANNLLFEHIHFGNDLAKKVCEVLCKHHVQSVIVEGGRQTLQTFIDSGLWDEARVFTGASRLRKGTPIPKFTGRRVSQEKIDTDILTIYKNDQEPDI